MVTVFLIPDDRWIPPSLSDAVGGLEDDARPWSRTINAFASCEVKHYREQLRSFLDGLQWSSPSGIDALIWDPVGGYTHPQPGSRLVQYAMGWLPDRTRNPTAIYARCSSALDSICMRAIFTSSILVIVT